MPAARIDEGADGALVEGDGDGQALGADEAAALLRHAGDGERVVQEADVLGRDDAAAAGLHVGRPDVDLAGEFLAERVAAAERVEVLVHQPGAEGNVAGDVGGRDAGAEGVE